MQTLQYLGTNCMIAILFLIQTLYVWCKMVTMHTFGPCIHILAQDACQANWQFKMQVLHYLNETCVQHTFCDQSAQILVPNACHVLFQLKMHARHIFTFKMRMYDRKCGCCTNLTQNACLAHFSFKIKMFGENAGASLFFAQNECLGTFSFRILVTCLVQN